MENCNTVLGKLTQRVSHSFKENGEKDEDEKQNY